MIRFLILYVSVDWYPDDWQDNARDILNFVSRYLPSRADAFRGDLPVHLPRVSDGVESARLQDGFGGERTLVGIGHSLGGAAVYVFVLDILSSRSCCFNYLLTPIHFPPRTLAAINNPALFSSLILVDPVICPPYVTRGPNVRVLALGSVQRRHTWKTREEARTQLASSRYFAAWDPEVLDNYVQFGLTPTDDGTVKLKMPGVQVSP